MAEKNITIKKDESKKGLVESFSGVRGVFGSDITIDLARQYARVYCLSIIKRPAVLVVAGDTRPSSEEIKKTFIDVFCSLGNRKVVDLGVLPIQTCQLYLRKIRADGGVFISASHNEPEFNGWKVLKSDGALLYPKDFEKLIKKTHQSTNTIIPSAFKKKQRTATKIVFEQEKAENYYVDYVLRKIGKKSITEINRQKIRILLDPNGGAACDTLQKIFARLNPNIEIINKEKGVFKRIIEPNVESLAPLSQILQKKGFDFAAGFDCDADRVEFVIPSHTRIARESGVVLSGNYVLALACDSLLEGLKGRKTVCTNDVTSYLVRDVVAMHSAVIKEAEVGEMPLVILMEKYHSPIGGEGSNGGVIVPPIKCRDGIMAVCLVLKMLAKREKTILEIVESYPKYYSKREKLSCSPFMADRVKGKLEDFFRKNNYKIKKTGGITGGLKAHLDSNNFVWFRQSKTEPGVFRIIADGNDLKKVDNLLYLGISLFNKFAQ